MTRITAVTAATAFLSTIYTTNSWADILPPSPPPNMSCNQIVTMSESSNRDENLLFIMRNIQSFLNYFSDRIAYKAYIDYKEKGASNYFEISLDYHRKYEIMNKISLSFIKEFMLDYKTKELKENPLEHIVSLCNKKPESTLHHYVTTIITETSKIEEKYPKEWKKMWSSESPFYE